MLGKIPQGAYLTVIAKFICRETLATYLLWLKVIASIGLKYSWLRNITDGGGRFYGRDRVWVSNCPLLGHDRVLG